MLYDHNFLLTATELILKLLRHSLLRIILSNQWTVAQDRNSFPHSVLQINGILATIRVYTSLERLENA